MDGHVPMHVTWMNMLSGKLHEQHAFYTCMFGMHGKQRLPPWTSGPEVHGGTGSSGPSTIDVAGPPDRHCLGGGHGPGHSDLTASGGSNVACKVTPSSCICVSSSHVCISKYNEFMKLQAGRCHL